jgi:hypothetical protein
LGRFAETTRCGLARLADHVQLPRVDLTGIKGSLEYELTFQSNIKYKTAYRKFEKRQGMNFCDYRKHSLLSDVI